MPEPRLDDEPRWLLSDFGDKLHSNDGLGAATCDVGILLSTSRTDRDENEGVYHARCKRCEAIG